MRKHKMSMRSFLMLFIPLSMLILSAPVSGQEVLPSVYKPAPEEYTTPVPPNVLLLIDTSGSMLQDLEGLWTWGDGSRPFNGQFYYGNETDITNNDPDGDSLSYYPPVTYLSQAQVNELGDNRISRSDMAKKGSRYLYPNDSRMYILKKVLWTIFTDPSMVEGLKMGLCTYHQDDGPFKAPNYTYTYKFWGGNNSNNNLNNQKISWQPTDASRALIRLPFNMIPPFSYSSSEFSEGVPDEKIGTNHWYDLLALIDGVETSNNDELRAIGGTPLEKSIHNEDQKEKIFYIPYTYKVYNASQPPSIVENKVIGEQPYPYNKYQWYPGEDVNKYEFTYRQISQGSGWWKKYVLQLCTREYEPTNKKFVWSCKILGNIENYYKNLSRPADCAYTFIKPAIEYHCQDNWLIVLTDGEDSDKSADPADAVEKLYDARDGADWPQFDGKKAKPVRTFVIAMLKSSSSTMNKMAYEGKAWEVDGRIKNNEAYYATDTDSLLEAFRTIFRAIQNNRSSSAPPKVQANLGEEGNIIYAASFAPKADGAWPGYLYKKKLLSSGDDGTIDRYETIWDGTKGIKGWKARDVYHAPWYDSSGESFSGTNLIKFPTGGSQASYVATNAGVPSSNSDNFVRWIRGGNWNKDGNRANPMLDIYRGDLLAVGKPPGTRSDPDFNVFAYKNRSRDKVVFIQGNSGMLQVFGDNDGLEVLGFIPPNMLYRSRIAGLVDNTINPELGSSKYLLAGPLVVEDAKVSYGTFKDEYRTVILGSLGYGGTGLYALDVTDPVKPSFMWARDSLVYSDNQFKPNNNDLLWSYSNSGSSLTSGDNSVPYLRRVLGRPFIGWVNDDWDGVKWVALFGAGAGTTVKTSDGSIAFDKSVDQGGRAIYALNISDGSVFKSITDDRMGQVIADLAVAKGQGRANYLRISRAFVGDSKGQLWRLDWKEDNNSAWSLDLIGNLSEGNGYPPLVHRLDLSLRGKQRWIFAATGDPYDLVPRSKDVFSFNCLVGFKEPLSGAIARNDLKTLGSADDYLEETDSEPGWIIPLEEGEFSTTPPVIYKGRFLGSTHVTAQEDPCEQGLTRLYMVGAFDGKGLFKDSFGAKKRYVELKGIKITGMDVKDGKVIMGILNPVAKKVEDLGFPEEIKAKMDSDGSILSLNIPDEGGSTSVDDVTRSGYWRRLW